MNASAAKRDLVIGNHTYGNSRLFELGRAPFGQSLRHDHATGTHGETVDDPRSVFRAGFDLTDFQLLQSLQKREWQQGGVEEGRIGADHDEHPVDVEPVAGQMHP